MRSWHAATRALAQTLRSHGLRFFQCQLPEKTHAPAGLAHPLSIALHSTLSVDLPVIHHRHLLLNLVWICSVPMAVETCSRADPRIGQTKDHLHCAAQARARGPTSLSAVMLPLAWILGLLLPPHFPNRVAAVVSLCALAQPSLRFACWAFLRRLSQFAQMAKASLCSADSGIPRGLFNCLRTSPPLPKALDYQRIPQPCQAHPNTNFRTSSRAALAPRLEPRRSES